MRVTVTRSLNPTPVTDPQADAQVDLQADRYFPNIVRGVTMLREPVVRKRRGRSRSSHHEDIKAELFVKPVLIGLRSTATPDYEVDALIAARIAGKCDQEIRALVRRLHAARKGVL